MADKIFPTQKAIGNSAGEGRVLTEQDIEALLHAMVGSRHGRISGLAVTNPSALTISVAAGQAIIAGHWVTTDAAKTIAAPDDANSRILLQLTREAGTDLVTGVILATQADAVGTALPADSLHLGRVVASGGSVTQLEDVPEDLVGPMFGSYAGNGATSPRTIALARTPNLVIVVAETINLLGISTPFVPNRTTLSVPEAQVVGVFFKAGLSDTISLVRAASKAWSPGNIAAGGEVSTTLTITGAAVGDPVHVWHDGIHASAATRRFLRFSGEITSANTATLYASNNDTGILALNGTVYAHVPNAQQALARPAGYSIGPNSQFRPYIVRNGFEVQRDVSDAVNLNESGQNYRYFAF